MDEKPARVRSEANKRRSKRLRFLRASQVEMIDEALSAVGEYGEVRLVVDKGRLRFVVTQDSHDALRWQPGSLDKRGAG